MNTDKSLAVSAAKVIATGSAGDALRVTLLLTPSVAGGTDQLAAWPGRVIEWLRQNQFFLTLYAEPANSPGRSKSTSRVLAGATGMEDVWRRPTPTQWVNALWAASFPRTKDNPDPWLDLANALAMANSTKDTLERSQNCNSALSPATAKGLDIRTSRQTDLALVLELNRALELCDSVKDAYLNTRQERVDLRLKEIGYLPGMRDENGKDPHAAAPGERSQSLHKPLYDDPFNKLVEPVYAANASQSNSAGPHTRESLKRQVDTVLPDYQAANRPENKTDRGGPLTESASARTFYALQSSPTLARLLGLAIDLRIPLQEMQNSLGSARFLYLSIDESAFHLDPKSPSILTLAKYLPGKPPHFWPTTQAEVDLGPAPSLASLISLPQYQGVSVGWRGSHRRFELSSLDARRATEATIDRQRILAEQTAAQSDSELQDLLMTGSQLQKLTTESPQRPAAFARKTYHTAGFAILDRGRLAQAKDQHSARTKHICTISEGQLLLDAADLLTGYRIDVGVPCRPSQRGQATTYAWRGLMARKVTYGVKGSFAKQIRSVAPRLFLEDSGKQASSHDSGWQKCLEDGYLSLTARLMSEDGQSPSDAYVDEAIATWNGEPMGVHIPGKRKDKVVADELPCGRVVVAPNATTEPSRRIPPLRFGYPYRFGLRAVYPGGISLPLSQATDLYDDPNLGVALSVPATPKTGPQNRTRRYLRHERIDAPLLLLPEEAALRRNGAMGYESATRAIVRSVYGSGHDRQHPTVAQRIFVAPGVSQSFACMHGVFDQTNCARPDEGLSSFRFGPNGVLRDYVRGGFPVVTTDHIVGINGFAYPSSRRVSTNSSGEGEDSGDLVYSTAPHAQANGNNDQYMPYYPDPAIKSFVLGVRVAGSDVYLKGKPCVIEVTGMGYSYPNTRPLVVTIERGPARASRSNLPRLDEVVTLPSGNGHLVRLPDGAQRFPGAVEALISLAPGEDFEIDVWCISDDAGLAKNFAIVETIASLAIAAAPKGDADFLAGLSTLMPPPFCQNATEYLEKTDSTGIPPSYNDAVGAGSGGLPAPTPRMLSAVASALAKALHDQPLDELAAVRTLRATHATDLPLAVPTLAGVTTASGQCQPLALIRTPDSRSLDKKGQGEFSLYTGRGTIEFDWSTTSSLEISADMASPSSDQMDDLERGRSIRDRRVGAWPHLQNGSPIDPSKILGFDVSATGDVTLIKTCGVPLYRLENIPLLLPEKDSTMQDDACPVNRNGFLSSIPLDKLLGVETNENYGRGKSTFQFTDGLARQLDLRVTAYSRHADQMRPAPPLARDGKWLRSSQPLSRSDSSRKSECFSVWLDACVRPAEPSARTPIPLFRWLDENPTRKRTGRRKKAAPIVHRRSRTAIIRIPIARPWFSSGEDERLGIVLWPPDFFSQKSDMLLNDDILFKGFCQDERGIPAQRRVMKLSNFQDEDLGPGGKFITRWGGDPTRFPAERLTSSVPLPPCRQSFIPASAFLDLSQDFSTGFTPELVPRVSMPIRVEESTRSPGDAMSADIPTLDVSLLAYRPKFDVSEEQWYVDVALEHPREAEPFVRLGLVRYQPHAPESLQVSYPVVQWTQLLPRRTVEVQRSGLAVKIRVEGLATCPHDSLIHQTFKTPRTLKDLTISSDEKERFPTARMIARIIREANLPIGVATRSVEKEVIFSETNTSYTKLTEGFYQAVWEQTLILDKMDLKHGSYFLIVEERDVRLPATYAIEPVSPDRAIGKDCNDKFDDGLLIESGLRFAAKIAI